MHLWPTPNGSHCLQDDEEKRIQEIEASLKKSGLDRERAQEVRGEGSARSGARSGTIQS